MIEKRNVNGFSITKFNSKDIDSYNIVRDDQIICNIDSYGNIRGTYEGKDFKLEYKKNKDTTGLHKKSRYTTELSLGERHEIFRNGKYVAKNMEEGIELNENLKNKNLILHNVMKDDELYRMVPDVKNPEDFVNRILDHYINLFESGYRIF